MGRTFEEVEFTAAIAAYRSQQQQAAQRLATLDEQREHELKTLDLLQGAIIALETLLQSPALPVDAPEPDKD
jgi:hypothetical protein